VEAWTTAAVDDEPVFNNQIEHLVLPYRNGSMRFNDDPTVWNCSEASARLYEKSWRIIQHVLGRRSSDLNCRTIRCQ
jgi:hypothetical protein